MSMSKQSWKELSSIQLGGAICLPTILIGFELARTGFSSAITSVVIGSCALFCLALVATRMSVGSDKTTAEHAYAYFGAMGMRFFAASITFSMSMWFAIQTQIMGHDIVPIVEAITALKIPLVVINVVASTLMVACALFGIRAIAVCATLMLPLMIATMGSSVAMAWKNCSNPLPDMNLHVSPSGISLVMAAAISAVVDLPTFFRHARTERDGMIATILTFLVGIPLIEGVGVLLGAWSSASTLNGALAIVDHPLWKAWIVFFIIIAGWTTNNTNLYSAAMSFRTILPLSEKKSTLVIGITCVVLSCCPLLENLHRILDLMGVCIVSMGGVILTAFFLKKRYHARVLHTPSQIISCIAGMSVGFINIFQGGFFTHIPILDALAVSALTLIVLRLGVIGGEVYEIRNEG